MTTTSAITYGLICAVLALIGISVKNPPKITFYMLLSFAFLVISSIWFFDRDPLHLLVTWLRDGSVTFDQSLLDKEQGGTSVSAPPVTNKTGEKNPEATEPARADLQPSSGTGEKPEQLLPTAVSNDLGNLVGTWVGTIDQPDGGQHKSYSIVLGISPLGDIITTNSDYPELNYGGTGKLISSFDNKHLLFESITYGQNRCLSGRFEISLLNNGNLYWEWDNEVASGVLTPR